MKFIVKPTAPVVVNKGFAITMCWKCSEDPAACGGDV